MSSKAKETVEFKVPSKFKYQEGEKVLCFHGPLIYEAKTLQCRWSDTDKISEYLIHYSGWNKSWDEWVPESRVLKYNEANVQKQKELHKAQKAEPKGKRGKRKSTTVGAVTLKGKAATAAVATTGAGAGTPESDSRSSTPVDVNVSGRASTSGTPSSSQESSSDIPRRKKNKTDPTVETEEQFLTKLEIKVKLPDELKPILVDDWEFITKQKRLLKIPARYTVDDIIADYIKQKQSAKNVEVRIETTDGIREYFNVMLGPQLLYKLEKKQYNEVLKENPDTPASKLYGAVHLIRFFVKIGSALAYTRLDEKSVQFLLVHLHDFLKFVHKNISTYFSAQDYTAPQP